MTTKWPTAQQVATAIEGTPEPVGLAMALKWCDDLTRGNTLPATDRAAITTVLDYLSEVGKDCRILRAYAREYLAPNGAVAEARVDSESAHARA